MKANEYVKEYGWDVAKKAVSICNYGYGIDLNELKRLVESCELVESLNGLIGAKACIREVYEDYPHDYMNRKLYDFDVKCCVVSRAIEDVESCQ